MRSFQQVDVFAREPFRGNPVAVVLDGTGLTDEQMQRFANWTNLSETTFLLPPSGPEADYRVRIFTGTQELPFAGHPTLGSCHAWLTSGGTPKRDGAVVQECGAGLVRLRRDGERLAFAAPPLRRSGPADEQVIQEAARVLRIGRDQILAGQWVDNGPGWLGLMLTDADAVLRVAMPEAAGLELGVIGRYPPGGPADFEVRAFFPAGDVMFEDPVTGSLNAGLAQWLLGSGLATAPYLVSQGTVLGRAGRVHVQRADGEIWIGGATSTRITGSADL